MALENKKLMLQEFESLLEYFRNGHYNKTLNLAKSLATKFPNQPFPWKILGALFKQIGNEAEALKANKKAVELDPKDIQNLINLGVSLKNIENYKEAEMIFKKALSLKPNSEKAHNNLGNTLKEMGKLEESRASFIQAISLKPDFAEAYTNLGLIFYIEGNIDSAIENYNKANYLNPDSKLNELLLKILESKKRQKEKNSSAIDSSNIKLSSNLLITKRPVESNLISTLYKMDYRELDGTPDTRFGKGRCSPNYNMFKEDVSVIKNTAQDLIKIIEREVKSKIYVYDSFFNIYGAGAGITTHDHITKIDNDKYLNLKNKKFSLVYYLSIGDQDCSKPGILKLNNPNHEIFPLEGMIVIFPADRKHSSVYNGKIDRVLIGVNFYCL